MKIIDKTIKYKMIKKLYHLVIKLDNSGNCNFDANGEKKFIKDIFKELTGKNNIILFDVGGNMGDYTQMLFDNVKNLTESFEIHVFEPTQYCFDKLNNRFDDKNIHLNSSACSNVTGFAKIHYDHEGSGLASMYQRNLKMCNNELKTKESIKTIRLDEYIKINDIQHIDFMKVDVEGHEISVFEGMGKYLSPDFVDCIQFEYGGANIDSMTSLMNFYDLFEEKGFVLAKVMPKGLQLRSYESFLENFEYSNYVALSKRLISK